VRIPFVFGQASALINMIDADLGIVNNVYSKQKRMGHAGCLMTDIVNWADSNGVTLLLSAQAFEARDALTNEQLVEFYARYGFVRERDIAPWPARMRREPSRELQGS
jgi:GNAT superfamily N-acetyltransferase